MPPDSSTILSQTDHDLLIELRTELRGMRFDVNKAADDTKERLIKLGENKLEKDIFTAFVIENNKFKSDHELRVRRLESWGATAIGGLYVVELILGWLFTHR